MGCIARIEKLTIGYEVEVLDSKIDKKNSEAKAAWVDPWKSYAFSELEQAIEFLTATLPKIDSKSGQEEFDSAFKEATKNE